MYGVRYRDALMRGTIKVRSSVNPSTTGEETEERSSQNDSNS